MFNKVKSHRLTARVLAALLGYPGAGLRAALPELAQALDDEAALPAPRRAEVRQLMKVLHAADPYEVEAQYVETFDRGRATSLHLFEHVHGDSRERGPAMIDLIQTYAQAGLHLGDQELPDHLPVVLEFVSTQPPAVGREFLGEMAHILNAVFSALLKRGSPYACVVAAVLELAGEKPQAVKVEADEPLDEAWAEPPAFDGCSTRGQAAPGQPQPIHIVRKTNAHAASNQGARA
ncbi:nitrate reductase molybdenum cofactor assembly chaperone [Azohydromonas caseinilytica]|uniref:Nitrate reductase molybdenum cofactor assembly chaperone n=1 Tax=Azohydromonas caseinilytica TaxID=2728836 RepID=A0A848F7W0_9BURK|nr:nitrate reductase molybdenum cofactor assembly chaperone [Azohydromonas caseinilytica]NML15268.1 nitrate reductase molybdenum cofactor assembly chaperone [Azohydromonas caseinilytica]